MPKTMSFNVISLKWPHSTSLFPRTIWSVKWKKLWILSFIYDLVKDMYSEVGRPSINPVILIKLTFIQYTFGIRSMRQTIAEVETNLA